MPRSIFLAYMYGRPISYLLNWNPPILGVDNNFSVLAFVGDVEPHLFKFWDNSDVRNKLIDETALNGTRTSLLFGGSGPCIKRPKYTYVTFCNIYEKILIIHLVVHGSVFQVDTGEVYFF